MRNLFSQKPAPDPVVVARLKGWLLELLELPAETPVMVTEVSCADSGCPEQETVLAVLEQRTSVFKVIKPMAEVTRDDLAAAVCRP